MSHRDQRNQPDERGGKNRPDTATDEVLREVEVAETRVTDSEKRRHRRGEAGDAITPNEQAQEESHDG